MNTILWVVSCWNSESGKPTSHPGGSTTEYGEVMLRCGILNLERDGTLFSASLSEDENFLVASRFANSSVIVGSSKNVTATSPAKTMIMVCAFFTVRTELLLIFQREDCPVSCFTR